jgi:hypothetical protein
MSDNESKELIVKEVVDPLDMSVPELARQLEKRAIMPQGIPEEIRLECGWYLKSWGRSNAELGKLLALSQKKVQRYIKKKREGNRLKYSADFQGELMGEIVYGWRARRQRLLRLVDADDIPLAEQLKAMLLLQQGDKDMVDILERLGYLYNDLVGDDFDRPARLNQVIEEEEREKAAAAKREKGKQVS